MSVLTTKDNPFNPLEHWSEWSQYDREKGYYTCEFLARIANTSLDLSDADYDLAVDAAIDTIVEMRPDMYKKILD